jgi:hypothetical protein
VRADEHPHAESLNVDPTGPALPREQVCHTINLSTGSISLAAVPGAESLGTDVTIANAGSGAHRRAPRRPGGWTSRYQESAGATSRIGQTLKV